MTEHYYTSEPQSASRPEQFTTELRGHTLKFLTDRGVFARGRIDFGSELLIEHVQTAPDAKVLDIGCGYGPIGLSLAKESPAREVSLVDVNKRAVALTKKNAQLNQIDNVRIFESDLFERVTDKDYDLIVTNPPVRAGKRVVYALFEQSAAHLRPGGELWLVIQKKQGAPSAYKKLSACFSDVQEVAKKKGYRLYKAIKS